MLAAQPWVRRVFFIPNPQGEGYECPLVADFVVKSADEQGKDRREPGFESGTVLYSSSATGARTEQGRWAFLAGLCGASGWHIRRRAGDQLCEPAEVLRDSCQCELELGTAWSAQSQTAEPQDALQMCEQHLNTLSVAA
jgi:hypothetical protein